MSQSDVDAELERLLSQTRAGTEPAADARARIRASLEPRLAAGPPPGAGRLKLLALVGAVAAIVIAISVWRARSPAPLAPSVPSAAPITPSPPVVTPPSAPVVVPPPSASASGAIAEKPAPRGAVPTQDPAAELRLISAMQLALRSDRAAQALALAEQHAQGFPRGALVQEREGVRAVARCRLAPSAARGALRESFLARYPSSPYAARVKDACR